MLSPFVSMDRFDGKGMNMKKGLVLEGGAMRGIYTAGVLDAFLEQNIAVDGVIGFNEAVFIIGVGIGGVGSHHAGGTALQVFFGLFLAAGDGVGQCFLGHNMLLFHRDCSFHGQADDEHRPLRWGILSIK